MTLKLLIINSLTLIRLIGTIVLIPIYKLCGGIYTGIISFICYFTDCIDGILARHFHASTFFGALFDGIADKLFTIINFIVLYLITPYALIPIIIEVIIAFTQYIKFHRKENVQSNKIGKLKVWILSMSVVLTFFLADINRLTIIPLGLKNYILSIPDATLYFWLLLPAIVMEFLTLLSYILELFYKNKQNNLNIPFDEKKVPSLKGKNSWETFRNIWLNPEFYEEHKNDSNLKDLRRLAKK